MAIIQPFKAVRPQPQLAAKVASLPYDVMNTKEARQMATGNPYSFLHVSRAEIDLDENVDEHSQQVYDQARSNFYKMISEGWLAQDDTPMYYVYAQTMNGRTQYGLVACSSVQDYFNDVIKKHEFTRPEKEEDRIHHMETVQAHVGPIFLAYPQHKQVDAIVAEVIAASPAYDFVAEDNVRHTVWIIADSAKTEALTKIFETEIPYTYIADGHHRTASAAKVGRKLQQQNPAHNGSEAYNFFLSVLFPDNQLAIMDYNRVVKDLNGLNEQEFLKRVSSVFEVEPLNAATAPALPHTFSMYLAGTWYKLTTPAQLIKTDPIGVLDVSILSDNLLNPILGIVDQRTDKRIDFIGGIRGLAELERRVNSGEMKVAFALHPVSLKQLMDIADSGNVMPPKSTWFEPKLRDGLFAHLF